MITWAGIKSVIARILAFCVAAIASGTVALYEDVSMPAVAIAAMLSAIYGFPGWLVTLWIAHKKALKSWVFFTLAGTVAGFIGVNILAIVEGGNFGGAYNSFMAYALPGGTIGGFVYWLIAVLPTRSRS